VNFKKGLMVLTYENGLIIQIDGNIANL